MEKLCSKCRSMGSVCQFRQEANAIAAEPNLDPLENISKSQQEERQPEIITVPI